MCLWDHKEMIAQKSLLSWKRKRSPEFSNSHYLLGLKLSGLEPKAYTERKRNGWKRSCSTCDGEEREWWTGREQKCWIGWRRSQNRGDLGFPKHLWNSKTFCPTMRGRGALQWGAGVCSGNSSPTEHISRKRAWGPSSSCMDGKDPEDFLAHWKIMVGWHHRLNWREFE